MTRCLKGKTIPTGLQDVTKEKAVGSARITETWPCPRITDWFVAMIYDIVAVEISLTFRQSERLCPPTCMQMTGK